MESKYGSRRKPSSGRGFILGTLAAFIAGGMLVGYVVYYNLSPDGAGEGASGDPATIASPSASPSATGGALLTPPTPLAQQLENIDPENPEEAVEAVKTVAEQTGGIEQRLLAAEQRLTALSLASEQAAGNAARLESLLIAFAVRRLIERGDELGLLTDQLRLRFGDERPNAVSTIINFSRRKTPLRIDRLVARLDGLGPELSQAESTLSWDTITREIGSLFSIRRQSTPSPKADQRLQRARRALEQGRIESAISEIKALPGAPKAQEWIADAEEYARVLQALDNIELAAVLAQSPAQQDSDD